MSTKQILYTAAIALAVVWVANNVDFIGRIVGQR